MFKTLNLKDLDIGRNNNCNLMRVFAAFLVIVSHSFLFLQVEQESFLYYPGPIGVAIFFILSGFFVSKSFSLSPTPLGYIVNRFLRIWPALILNTFLIILFASMISTDFWTNKALFFENSLKYLYDVLLLNSPDLRGLPGVFTNHFYPVLNGPLWTLLFECAMYCILGVLGILGILKARTFTIFFLFFLMIYVLIVSRYTLISSLAYTYLQLSSMFVMGMAFQMFKHKIKLNLFVFILALSVFIFFQYLNNSSLLLMWIQIITLAYSVFWLCYVPQSLLIYNKLGDFSYGLYIYGWPIGQTLSSYIRSPSLLIISTTCVSLLFAAISWHFVEKKAIALKQKLKNVPLTLVTDHNTYQRFIWIIVFLLLFVIFFLPSVKSNEMWHQLSHHSIIDRNLL